ncbi:hypothetical protein P3339_17215 [Microbulbifer sp. MLAF003]|uniref:hypothetical protein n=1 Tax=Microbulbifer sp. MLAF003 TaxID=3032582 RepID=UPI0024AD79A2|nr:hypothetical protein [Microbulbifer sp. MLAF003]WHI50171.1 hypothetical protein P3339_17215 [Microbulbifer sp. MLAF003]
MKNINLFHVISLPLLYLITWYEKGYEAAIFYTLATAYLVAGVRLSFDVFTNGFRDPSEISVWDLVACLYCAGCILLWFWNVGVDRTAYFLLFPVVFSLIIIGVLKIFRSFNWQ